MTGRAREAARRILGGSVLAHWLSLGTAIGQLALAVLCFVRSRHSPLALPLGALCFMMFGFSLAEWAYSISGVRGSA